MRTARRALVLSAAAFAVAVLALTSLPALAQVGAWGPAHPAWIDYNGNGRIDTGELGPYPAIAGTGTPGDPYYYIVKNNPLEQPPCSGVVSAFGVDNILNPTTLTREFSKGGKYVLQTVQFITPSTFTFSEAKAFIPPATRPSAARKAPLVPSPNVSGSGAFYPVDANGVTSGFSLTATPVAGSPVTVQMSWRFVDLNGDGRADYVSFPWTLAGLAPMGVQRNACLPSADPTVDPPVYLPLTSNVPGGSKPVTVVVDPERPAGVSAGLTGPPIVPLALQDGSLGVPTLSQWGLLALTASIAAWGWTLLRQRGLAI